VVRGFAAWSVTSEVTTDGSRPKAGASDAARGEAGGSPPSGIERGLASEIWTPTPGAARVGRFSAALASAALEGIELGRGAVTLASGCVAAAVDVRVCAAGVAFADARFEVDDPVRGVTSAVGVDAAPEVSPARSEAVKSTQVAAPPPEGRSVRGRIATTTSAWTTNEQTKESPRWSPGIRRSPTLRLKGE
jgi:hypothetical protein